MNDPAIICLFFKRDESALSETDAKYGAYCKSVAARILENDEDAEECWSDALYKLWQTIPPKKPDDLGAYSAKVARSTAIDRLRKNGAGKRGDKVTEYIEELGDCDAALSAGCPDETVFLRDYLAAGPAPYAALKEYMVSLYQNRG